MSNGGSLANLTGNSQERFIKERLNYLGYTRIEPSRKFWEQRERGEPIYSTQCVIGKNVYGGLRKADVILYHPKKWVDCLVIESKWQSSTGSVDSKYPFEVQTINMNAYPTIIVLDGQGYNNLAGQWLQSQSGKCKILHVVNQGGFARLASNGFFGRPER